MELVGRIFETLEINQLALVQLALVIVLTFLLSGLLIKPLLRTFEERERLSVKPVEESRRLLAEAETKARQYEEALRKGSLDAFGRKRGAMEEASRAERKRVESVAEETGRDVEAIKGKVLAEKEAASAVLRTQVSILSREIAEKVLGRGVA
jgi:F-type H+-transporting ATPase subunit b